MMINSIMPNMGVGDIYLRRTLSEYSKLLAEKKSQNLLEVKDLDDGTQIYHLIDMYLELFVDKRNGKICKIAMLKGFEGSFEEKIYVGMTIPEACKNDSRLYFKESESLMFFEGVKGICVELGVDDPWPEELKNLYVDSIAIFAEEAFTFEGTKGNW
ncbi:hypothetical protein [Pseudoalteromonas sp. S16_S37]|uniref:hypothetical protein n=1 Tax=Pseudoalteromonas sp. S16_S37 TaxID=2720228 RepID=UPI0016813DFD|nr:hypothetical protein [Pseudoalteromonas sp. S16_S37]MBD1584033.1 hypothetical protein [Pseudoalteromonas sp. S16_S37]